MIQHNINIHILEEFHKGTFENIYRRKKSISRCYEIFIAQISLLIILFMICPMVSMLFFKIYKYHRKQRRNEFIAFFGIIYLFF